MIAALLAGLVCFSLFAGRLPSVWLAAVCLLTAAGFLFSAGHRHDSVLTMDVYARRSRLCRENAAWKAAGSLALLILCICSSSAVPPLCLFCFLSAVTVAAGGIRARDYLSLLGLPAVFLLLSALTLLWDFYPRLPQEAAVSVPLFGGWLAVVPAAQSLGMLVLSRALGAVSCLYFLSLSTPLPELLEVLRRARIPAVVTELAVLMYRYIFLLLATFRDMRDSAASRLGYRGLKRSLRTTGLVYGGLLAGSFRRAGACFDAMESRCYTGQIRFLTEKKKVTAKGFFLLAVPLAGMLAGVCMGF
ncbi:cobalt ECF transporter T component CbiQ [Anaerofilum sp. An201]|nr:cobalt ECF transporter T component CbiQ [Anaerofilum sp. An201]OUP03962.1 cobalt ECF transporter T component CbiQ [Anaerofilum sp. An201]